LFTTSFVGSIVLANISKMFKLYLHICHMSKFCHKVEDVVASQKHRKWKSLVIFFHNGNNSPPPLLAQLF
jgi:hypothetical protein